MPENLHELIANAYRRTHLHAFEVITGLSEEQLARQATESTPSMLFHVWHMARWADFLYEVLTEPGNQYWVKENLAIKWGLPESQLGYAATGFGMDDRLNMSVNLRKSLVLDYASKAFSIAEGAVYSASEKKLLSMYKGPRAAEYYQGEQTFGYIVLRSLRHESRHVGMMESLRGVLGFGSPPSP